MNTTICYHCRRAAAAATAARQTLFFPSTSARSRTAFLPSSPPKRTYSATSPPARAKDADADPDPDPNIDISSILSQPTWSVRSLLPPPSSSSTPDSPSTSSSATTMPTTPEITPQTLAHLLRLSALPQPASAPDAERQMLRTLGSQLGFARAVRGVDTRGVAPLRAIRDETAAGLREQAVGVGALRAALAAEDAVGHARRPRRRRAGRRPGLQQQEEGGAEAEGEVVSGTTTTATAAATTTRSSRNEVEDWDVLGGASETAGGRYFVVRSSTKVDTS